MILVPWERVPLGKSQSEGCADYRVDSAVCGGIGYANNKEVDEPMAPNAKLPLYDRYIRYTLRPYSMPLAETGISIDGLIPVETTTLTQPEKFPSKERSQR